MASMLRTLTPGLSAYHEHEDDTRASSHPLSLHIPYPQIAARFREEDYTLREALLKANTRVNTALPPGYPEVIDSPAAWNASSLSLADVTFQLSPHDLKELAAALKHFEESKQCLNFLGPENFPLPTLGDKLRQASREIHSGRGVFILRGFDVSQQTLKSSIIMFAGLSSYIGDQRGSQSANNDVLTHLYSTHDRTVQDPRPGLSNHGLPFHNDHCDILALCVVETANAGGATRWCSGEHLYNIMAKEKPQVIRVLSQTDWPHETAVRTVKHLPLMYKNPGGKPFLNFTRFALTGLPSYPRDSQMPQLTPEQADALDTLQYLANKHAVEVEQEKGDLLFINNRAILHARDKICDPPGESQRHLIRLCLRDSEYGDVIPEDLKKRWGDIFDGDQQRTGQWTLEKKHDARFVSNKQFDSAFGDETGTGSHG